MSIPSFRRSEESDTVPLLPLQSESPIKTPQAGSVWLGSGSVAIASIEAICTFFLAASKLGILVGFTSFLSTVIVSRYHADRVRVPVLALALAGAITNLVVLWNQRRLRNRPSSVWRMRPTTARQRRRTWFLVGLALAAIALIVGEFWIHPVHFH